MDTMSLMTLIFACTSLSFSLSHTQDKAKPILVVDGRGASEFKRWRKATMHPSKVSKKMLTKELLVN